MSTPINITIHTTNETLVPAMVTILQHKYKHADKEEAIEDMDELLGNLVLPVGIVAILKGEIEPLFEVSDLMQDALTYSLDPSLLSQRALDAADEE